VCVCRVIGGVIGGPATVLRQRYRRFTAPEFEFGYWMGILVEELCEYLVTGGHFGTYQAYQVITHCNILHYVS
jgi:hypothetical protein